ncbi:MAG: two-component regulator propeller domain-containing protein [Nitrospirota bacterium]
MTPHDIHDHRLVIAWLASGLLALATLSSCSPVPRTPPTGKWTNFETGANVKSIAINGRYLWLGLSNGVIRYDAETHDTHEIYTAARTSGGLLSNGVYAVRVDSRDRVWIGTYGGGLSVFDGASWFTFTPYGAGRVVTYGEQWTRYTPGRGLGDLWVYDVAFDTRGGAWVATWKGLSRIVGRDCFPLSPGRGDHTSPGVRPCEFETYTVEDGLVDKWVYAIAVDGDGALWLGTEGGVNRFDGTRWTTYTHRDGLGADPSTLPSKTAGEPPSPHHTAEYKGTGQANPNYVLAIAIDGTGAKWFGTWGAGLSRFDGKRWTTFTKADGLGGNYIHALGVDRDGVLWAGTDGGASWYRDDRWRTYTTRDGLLDNNVFSMAFDARGVRWFGTWKGLSKLELVRQ